MVENNEYYLKQLTNVFSDLYKYDRYEEKMFFLFNEIANKSDFVHYVSDSFLKSIIQDITYYETQSSDYYSKNFLTLLKAKYDFIKRWIAENKIYLKVEDASEIINYIKDEQVYYQITSDVEFKEVLENNFMGFIPDRLIDWSMRFLKIEYNNDFFIETINEIQDLNFLHTFLDKEKIKYIERSLNIDKRKPLQNLFDGDKFELFKSNWLKHTIFICRRAYDISKLETYNEVIKWCKNDSIDSNENEKNTKAKNTKAKKTKLETYAYKILLNYANGKIFELEGNKPADKSITDEYIVNLLFEDKTLRSYISEIRRHYKDAKESTGKHKNIFLKPDLVIDFVKTIKKENSDFIFDTKFIKKCKNYEIDSF